MRWLALLLLTALGLLTWALIVAEAPQIAVENRTGLRIAELELLVNTQRAHLDPLGPSDLVRQIVPLREEGPARLRIRFAGAAACTLDAGWFAPGQQGVPSLILVAPDSVTFRGR